MMRPVAERMAILLTFLVLTSCTCVQELSLKPSLQTDDLRQVQQQQGGKSSAAVDVSIKFRDCCPSPEQRRLLMDVQKNVVRLYDDLVAGRIQLQDYNAKVEAARAAVEQVSRVCGTRGEVDAAWNALAVVNEQLGHR